MNRKSVKKLLYRSTAGVAVMGLGLTIAPQKAKAIFGLDFDPIQSAHAIVQIGQFAQQIEQMEHQVMLMKSQIVDYPNRIKSMFSVQRLRSLTTHLYPQNWGSTTVSLQPSALLMGNDLLRSTSATVGMADTAAGNAAHDMKESDAQLRDNQTAISNLQGACAAGGQSQAMQLSCVSAAGIVSAQSQQTTNALISSLLNVQAAQLKFERDKQAAALNFQSKVLEYWETEPVSLATSSRDLQNLKLF
jgi:hypothetical protein